MHLSSISDIGDQYFNMQATARQLEIFISHRGKNLLGAWGAPASTSLLGDAIFLGKFCFIFFLLSKIFKHSCLQVPTGC
jgi:hypothetical protein